VSPFGGEEERLSTTYKILLVDMGNFLLFTSQDPFTSGPRLDLMSFWNSGLYFFPLYTRADVIRISWYYLFFDRLFKIGNILC
jgi:hypothetical protein